MALHKRSHSRRRPTRRPKKTTRAIAKRGLRIAKVLSSGRQTKYLTTTSTLAVSSDSSPALVPLTINIQQISQATTASDTATFRVGDTVMLRSIRIKGFWNSVDQRTTAAGPFLYRILIVQDRQQVISQTPSITDVLLGTPYITSPYNYPYEQKRFKIYYDKTFSLNPYPYVETMAGLYAPMAKAWEHWVFPTSKKLQWNSGAAGSGTAFDQQKNHIYMFVCTANAGASVSELIGNLQVQLAFNDS